MQQTLNAVIYARYSSHNQTEQSIEGQLRDCYAFAERQGLQVVGEYIDRAITGRTDDRPEFQRMIADARKRQFQRVVVWKLDRFARDRYDSAIYKHKLKQYGVKVLSAMENIGEGSTGVILEALLEGMAEQYSLDLSEKVLRGQRESRLKGHFLGGHTPMGYKVENMRLVVDERTAPTVRYIFEEYAKGTPKKQIIAELNARGIRNSAGKPLTDSSIQGLLKNKKYIGIYEHGGEKVAGGCDALIDEELFNKVQKRIDKVKHAPAASKAKTKYLLQGKIFCGYCGSSMNGESGRGRLGDTYYYYSCRKRKKQHACDKKNEKKDYIEWYVVEQTVEYVLTPERIEYIATELVAQYQKDCGSDRVEAYEKQLERINAEISRLVDTLAVCPAAARQPIFDKMENLDVEKREVEIDLAKLRVQAKAHPTEDQIIEWLQQFCKGDPLDIDFREKIIDTFINAVYLYDDKVVIYYNIEGSKQINYMEILDSTEEPPFSDDTQASCVVRISNAPGSLRNLVNIGVCKVFYY
ncbi:MAG: recombinase family protein [Eubacterium sp.]|nr:recombinase family protein [Eubacterium sp.]